MAQTKAELQEELQAEALSVIGDQYNVAVEIGTGGGKTLLGLKHMAKQYHDSASFLVAATTNTIFVEWEKNAKQFGYEYLLEHITFVNYRSLTKQIKNYDWFYADECHGLLPSHDSWLMEYQLTGGKMLGLTGTYPKRGVKKEICESYIPKIFYYSVDEAIEAGMLNNYVIWVHMLKLESKYPFWKKSKNGNKWKTTELKDYNWHNSAINGCDNPKRLQMLRIMRMKALQSYSTKIEYIKSILKKIPEKCLIFVNTKAQADEICDHSYHSSNKDSEKNLEMFANDEIYRLSAVEQLSEGKSIKNLRVGIISHSYSNNRKTQQKVGRFLRLNPDEKAIIHILCYEDTIDKQWVFNALKDFDQSKIKIHRP